MDWCGRGLCVDVYLQVWVGHVEDRRRVLAPSPSYKIRRFLDHVSNRKIM